MSRVALSSLVFAAMVVAQAPAQITFPATPLVSMNFPNPSQVPYQVYPEPNFVRGPQTGYNLCNSTTETQDSLCQTSFVDDITDFCLWAPPKPNSTIADTEGEEVAWCSKHGHGSRLMPAGTLISAQLLKTPDYIMITGKIDQTKINIQDGDFGGELDSGGQDERGNPIGGLLYSNGFTGSVIQIQHWTEFIGSSQFCVKICNPSGSNPEGYCQHTLDRIGLLYNCPSKYTSGAGGPDGLFEVCDSDDMTVPGIYTLPDGTTTSYSQPAESLGAITTLPYTPTVPSSSNCVTKASTDLYTDLATVTPAAGAGSASSSGASSAKPTASSGASGSNGGSSSGGAPSRSGSAGTPGATGAAENAAATLHVSLFAAVVGTLFAAVFLS